ncbi:SUKH-3 domain-containing protein [Streptomyces sp. NPDC056909]|uniref:SUKH-3 domain-containing protein n=1 Tax=Streptomyces sp. NPDC056909 TaxID=3345963 RepID=UPI0036BA4F0C
MGPEGGERGYAEAWAEVLEACRPRPAGGDPSSPSMWLLLQAAVRDPVLSAMYPWISMRQLGVSTSGSWQDWGYEPLPAMFARPDVYSVVGREADGGGVVLETADPAEAAAFAARLVCERRAARVKGPYVRSAEVEAVLRDAGWRPGRSVDTAVWREVLEADGFRMHLAAEEFLREFGGLRVGDRGPGITRAREAIEFDPLLAVGEGDYFGEWSEEIGHRLFPVGELDHGRAFLGLDEQGELYAVADWPARFGRMPEAMENLVLGVMPVYKGDFAQP